MAKQPRPVPSPRPALRERGTDRTDKAGEPPDKKSFAELEREHARAVEAGLSAKRRPDEPGHVDKRSGKRAARPRSGRSGSDSNASRSSRGH